MPSISVLLPVFNGERFIAEAVQSILSQSFADFELLIIDDGSTDGTLAIIRSLAAADPRIKYRSRANRGLVVTLNELLSMAGSPYLARMDADDIADPRRFEVQLQELEKDSALLAVGSDVHFIDSRGRMLMTVPMPHSHEEIDACTMEFVHGCGMCHPSMMFRAAAFELAGTYREEYWPAEDADLVLRIAEKGRLANLPQPLLCYRAHEGSIGHTRSARQRDALFRAAADAARRRGCALPDESLRVLPSATRDSIETPAARDTKWAWWALNNGNIRTARSLALRAVLNGPLKRDTWRVLACSIRGH